MTRAAPLPRAQAQRRSTIAQRTIGWVEIIPSGAVASFLPAPHRVFQAGGLRLIVSLEPIGWHMSISHPRRYPTWDEIADARYRFIPDHVTMAMLLPPRSEYVNLHETCMHLHQISGPMPGVARGSGTLEGESGEGVV